MIGAAAGPASHVAVAHEDANRAEVLARVLRTAGHRVTVVVPGRRIAQSLVEAEPDLVIASLTLIDDRMND